MTAKDIYEGCRAWLQFAETKNGFALAFCGAALAAETSLLSGVDSSFKHFILFSILLMTLAAICSLVSFIPQERVQRIGPAKSSSLPAGIVYFGQIARQDAAAYVAHAKELLSLQDNDLLSLELLRQCHSLSLITVRKLRLFYATVVIAGLAIVAPLLGAFLCWLPARG